MSRGNHARGARSYDVGCFQINYRWHGQHFASLDQMFDPDANAAYAARFLSELYAEFGDWSRAAGAYHSRTPVLSPRSTASVSTAFAAVSRRGR
jgi:soluble lytic murein transglycosylase-like protein